MTDLLTNETLKGICESNFELVHYAIKLARYYMQSGRDTSLKEVLRDVKRHPNPSYLQELISIDEIEREAQARTAAKYE